MTKYVFNEQNKKTDVRILCVDKEKKKISSEMVKYFSKDDIALFEKAMKTSDSKTTEFMTNDSKVVLLFADYDKSEFNLQKLGAKIGSAIFKYKNSEVYVEDLGSDAKNLIIGIELSKYRFNKYFTLKKDEKEPKIEKVSILGLAKALSNEDVAQAISISSSVNYTRELVNEPANILNSESFAKSILGLKKKGLDIKVLEEKDLKKLGFNLLLSVNQASANKPKVVVMLWKGNSSKKGFDVALVGKGVTFDTGGLSLKPSSGMEDMHTDMAGAAAVCGAIKAISELQIKKNVLGIVGLVENSVSANATRVNDIITSMSGQTVEVMNTDAEGRLVLADLLTYVQKEYGAKKIIDLATLTGAVSRLFGPVYAGLFSNDDDLATALSKSGDVTGDKMWRLPVDKYYDEAMDSDVADMRNSGKNPIGGGSQGACFLKRFIEKETSWAHIDIAGVARESTEKDLDPKGSTGYGVKLLVDYIAKN